MPEPFGLVVTKGRKMRSTSADDTPGPSSATSITSVSSARLKEIGIRKTLGASSSDIVKLLVAQFLRPVLIANLFAWPLAFFAARTWLAGFDDRIALSPAYFIGASVVAVLIAVLTVLSQSVRASRAAPAWALRHD